MTRIAGSSPAPCTLLRLGLQRSSWQARSSRYLVGVEGGDGHDAGGRIIPHDWASAGSVASFPPDPIATSRGPVGSLVGATRCPHTTTSSTISPLLLLLRLLAICTAVLVGPSPVAALAACWPAILVAIGAGLLRLQLRLRLLLLLLGG